MRILFKIILGTIFFCEICAERSKLIEMKLGTVDVNTKIGNLSEKYEPMNPVDRLAQKNALLWVEELKTQFLTGGANFPPIDPYVKDKLSPFTAGGNSSLLSGNVVLKNLHVIGAKDLAVNNIEVRLKDYRQDFNFSVPNIVGEVDFEAELLIKAFIPMTYDGHVRVILKGINVIGAANAKKKIYKNVPVFQLNSLHVQAHVDDLQIFVDDELGQTISGLDKEAIEVLKNDLAIAVTKTVFDEINLALRGYPASTILKSLLKLK